MSHNASAIEVQSNVAPDVTATEVIQCVTQRRQEKSKLMQCPAQEITVLQDRKCQKVESVHMQPQEPKSYKMQSRKPAIKNYSDDNKSSSPVRKEEDDKNCQSRCVNEKSP